MRESAGWNAQRLMQGARAREAVGGAVLLVVRQVVLNSRCFPARTDPSRRTAGGDRAPYQPANAGSPVGNDEVDVGEQRLQGREVAALGRSGGVQASGFRHVPIGRHAMIRSAWARSGMA